jgi:hypothetical protein
LNCAQIVLICFPQLSMVLWSSVYSGSHEHLNYALQFQVYITRYLNTVNKPTVLCGRHALASYPNRFMHLH